MIDELERQWKIDVARAEWRAELCQFAAAAADAEGKAVEKDDKLSLAEYFTAEAEALRDYHAALGKNPNTKKARAATLTLQQHREFWRGISEYLGNPRITALNDFPEPSADELFERFTS